MLVSRRTTRIILLMMSLLLALTLPTAAQVTGPAYAAVSNGELVLVDVGAEMVQVATPPHRDIYRPAWSPDGTKLAYLISDEDWMQHLVVADITGSAFVLETGALEAGFAPAWTPDGDILFIGQGEFPTNADDPYMATVNRVAPEAGAQAETIAKFPFVVGCGGGSPLPSDWQYWTEAGFGGANLTLVWTEYGLLHSTRCSGMGLALLDLDSGIDTPIQGDLPQSVNDLTQAGIGRAALSSDGQQVAAVHWMYTDSGPVYELVVIDLATLDVTTVATTAEPDQVAWGPDGSILYSARAYSRDVLAGLSDEALVALKPIIDPSVTGGLAAYSVSIYQVDPATGSEQVVFSGDASAVGRMALAADGQTLLFSLVPNLDNWVQAIVDGRLDPLGENADQRAFVPVSLMRLALGSGEEAAFDGYRSQFALRPA